MYTDNEIRAEVEESLALLRCSRNAISRIETALADRAAELIRRAAELERRAAAYDELRSLNYGNEHTLYAVVGLDDVRYGISGSILGLYESEELAKRVASDLATGQEDDDWMACGNDGPTEYVVKTFTVGAYPTAQFSWCYFE